AVSRGPPGLANAGCCPSTGAGGGAAGAAACAKLRKLPAEKIADVIGIAVSLASGVAANYGTMTKPLHSGNAARNGVMAAMLGSRGFTAPPGAFGGVPGFFTTVGPGL